MFYRIKLKAMFAGNSQKRLFQCQRCSYNIMLEEKEISFLFDSNNLFMDLRTYVNLNQTVIYSAAASAKIMSHYDYELLIDKF